MKNSLLLMAFAAILFAGCGGSTHDHTDGNDTHEHTSGSHTHDDGTTHDDHHEMQQEEFNVETDTATVKPGVHTHQPGDDHQH
ncbi:MAG: hypothetical protein ACR2GN_09170 [Bacteroidia bacterium]|nr:hypothetical protein [Nitrosopumilus sp.]